MSPQTHTARDPIESAIERTLDPGRYFNEGDTYTLTRDLDEVAATIAELAADDSVRAAELYETFIAACYLRSDNLDDSYGDFGRFVGELACGWIKARQLGHADPSDTVSCLLAWMDHDDYGYFHRLEQSALPVFDDEHIDVLRQEAESRFDSKPQRWGTVLRAIHTARHDVATYVALAERTGLTPEDCHTLATLLKEEDHAGDALEWVEKGLQLAQQTPYSSQHASDLEKLRRKLLVSLDRRDEAIDAAWRDFQKYPGDYRYHELMAYVPKSDRVAWHRRAIEAAMGARIDTLMELLLATDENDLLLQLVGRTSDAALEDISHSITQPAAERLESSHPHAAARLWQAQGLRIVNAGKSRYYDAALENLEQAMHCYRRAGREADWRDTVQTIRTRHARKSSFMPHFDRLVAGDGPSAEPSFIERAKADWKRRLST